MSRLTPVLFGAQLLMMGANAMAAQESGYDENALRVESRQGNLQILRGMEGTVVARAGIFHPPRLANLVIQSDSALAEAKIFERDYEPGQWIAALGIATLGAAIGASRISDINPVIQVSLYATSFAALAYGGNRLHSAYGALSKAIWWYNRDLKR
jgi:hypothetical protein